MVISSSTVTHDFTIWLRNALRTNITDPRSGSRNAASAFVATTFPQRITEYPLMVVEVVTVSDRILGVASEGRIAIIRFRVKIFSKSTKQRDQLFDEVYNFLRTYQLGSGESLSEGLFDFKIVSSVNVDEIAGKSTVHQKVIEGSYNFIVS